MTPELEANLDKFANSLIKVLEAHRNMIITPNSEYRYSQLQKAKLELTEALKKVLDK